MSALFCSRVMTRVSLSACVLTTFVPLALSNSLWLPETSWVRVVGRVGFGLGFDAGKSPDAPSTSWVEVLLLILIHVRGCCHGSEGALISLCALLQLNLLLDMLRLRSPLYRCCTLSQGIFVVDGNWCLLSLLYPKYYHVGLHPLALIFDS